MKNREGKIIDFLSQDNDGILNIEISLLKQLEKKDFQEILEMPLIDGKKPQEFVDSIISNDKIISKYGKGSEFWGSEQIALIQLYANIFFGSNLKIDGKLGPASIKELRKISNKKLLKEVESQDQNILKNLTIDKDNFNINNLGLKDSTIKIQFKSQKSKDKMMSYFRKKGLSYDEISKIALDIYNENIQLTNQNGKYLYKGFPVILNKGDIVSTTDQVENINLQTASENKNNSTFSEEFEDKKTKEHIGEITGAGFFNSGKVVKRNKEFEELSMNSKASLGKILSRGDLIKIAEELKQAAPKDNIFRWGNHSQIDKVLMKYGYDSDGILGVDEVSVAYSTILDWAYNQGNIKNLTKKDKLMILLDFDKDGVLSKDLNYYVGELQSYYLVLNSLTSQGVDVFLNNLGLGSMDDFGKHMEQNLYLSREKFHRLLGSLIQMKIKPAELTKQDGVRKAIESIYENQKQLTEKISTDLEINEELDKKLSTLKDIADVKQLKTILKLEAIGIFMGGNNGIGASFDIKKFVKGFVDSIQVGMINGNLGVSFTKELLEAKGFKIVGGLANFYIPLLGISYTYENEELIELMGNKLQGNYKPSVYIGLSTVGQTIGVNVEKKGIEDNVKAMKKNMEIIKIDLLNGKDFDNSEFSKNSINKLNDQLIYQELKNFYDIYGKGKDHNKKILESLVNGYLNYYEDYLYSQAVGPDKKELNITSYGGGVALIGGFLPLPYLTLGGEYLSQEYTSVDLRISQERKTTSTKLSNDKLGFSIVHDYKGKSVYSIDANYFVQDMSFRGEYEFSSESGEIQVERVGDKFYFSSEDIINISVDEHVNHNGVKRTIVINDGQLDNNGLYIKSKHIPINVSIKVGSIETSNIHNNLKYSETEDKLTTFNKENYLNTKISRESIFNIISKPIINQLPQLATLQKDIFDYSNGNRTDLGIIWERFVKLINFSEIGKIATDSKDQNDYINLKNEILNKSFNEEEKIMILQSIPACLMKKSKLQLKDGNVEIGTKIVEYDKRGDFFDKLFQSKLPSMIAPLRQARKQWMQINGNKSNYEFRPISDGSLALVGTQTLLNNGKENVSGVMNYYNCYNVADCGQPFININGKSSEMINGLPNNYLKGILSLVNSNYSLGLKDINELKAFINNSGNEKYKFDYEIAYCKMGECLNDTLVIRNMKILPTSENKGIAKNQDVFRINVSTTSEVYAAVNDRIIWGVGVSGNKQEKHDKDKTTKFKDDPHTDPDIANEKPNIQPGNNLDQ